MILHQNIQSESKFILTNVSLFLQRFTLSYFKEGLCIEYFINKCNSTELVPSSLIFSYNPVKKDLHISRFYPDLFHQPNSKYMSAACFYLLIHHCADSYSLDDTCYISLETVPIISEGFYKKLKDFDFYINKFGLGDSVELISHITRLPVNTSMIRKHVFQEGEIPFLK